MPSREIWKAFFYARYRGVLGLVIAKNAVMKQSQRSLKQGEIASEATQPRNDEYLRLAMTI